MFPRAEKNGFREFLPIQSNYNIIEVLKLHKLLGEQSDQNFISHPVC